MFQSRHEAGLLLARAMHDLKGLDPIVLGLPRGGVPVASLVADELGAPLDVVVVRKLGVPYHPEYAMGAVGERGIRHIDWHVVSTAGVSASQLATAIEREQAEVEKRAVRFRRDRSPVDLSGRVVIIVDDGVATGSTVTAAIRVVRDLGAERVIVGVPAAPADTVARLRELADEVVVLETPEPFYAVGQAYVDFSQVDDREVVELLERARRLLQARDRKTVVEA
jgi:putative phosphoribosyl transferase